MIKIKNIGHGDRVHFIGIGGIGISALARFFNEKGATVSGSDNAESVVTDGLRRCGVSVYIGQSANNLPDDVKLVVYTIAVPDDNIELLKARSLGVLALSYPQALGEITNDFYTIAISGTHGKTTTTAMSFGVLQKAGFSPSLVVGTLLPPGQTNYIKGEGDFFIVEACEYRRSFLNLSPKILIVTNIEEEHLDYYKDLSDIQSAFSELVLKIPPDGFLICNTFSEALAPVIASAQCCVVDYSTETASLRLKQPGDHNRQNAKAVLALSRVLGIEKYVAVSALEDFGGTWRRFEYKGKSASGALVYDDYGHHPTEIAATIIGAREKYPEKRIILAFQPHLQSRTDFLFDGFVESLALADEVVVADIYRARLEGDGKRTSGEMADAIRRTGRSAVYLSDFGEIQKHLEKISGPNDIILTLGAGELYRVAEKLVEAGSSLFN